MATNLEALSRLIRYYILVASTAAGSGHPTSSLSAVELMTTMMFGGFFRFDLEDPKFENNDRLIFSKGHASPLFYALYAAAGKVTEDELKTFRAFDSRLEGHPTPLFPYTEAATGSLGQGLSIGVGMALNAKMDGLSYKTFVLMGDSEMAEGSVWEAAASASHHKLDSLIGIIDVNRLGQRGETMYGHDVSVYSARAAAFGWRTVVIDGHSLDEIKSAFETACTSSEKPTMIIAKTFKGKGISFVEDKDEWHGKALKKEEMEKAIAELGAVDALLRGAVAKPERVTQKKYEAAFKPNVSYKIGELVATRRAYGNALVALHQKEHNLVVLDAEVSNSTFSEIFKKEYPERFIEMFIAEQNMAGVALGFARRGKIPFASSFAAFLSRAHDQIRMSNYSDAHIVFVGSHAGVSIGEDGASQMALEDIAMFRPILDSVVLYPSDAVSTEKSVYEAARQKGIVYIRTTRMETPVLYGAHEEFPIGGSKVVRQSENDRFTVIGAGVTLHEALKAHEMLAHEGIMIRVIDLYSIKPIDTSTLLKASMETKAIVTVEDHYAEGGLGEAVQAALAHGGVPVHSLAVAKMPRSGKPAQLLAYEEIDADAIVAKIQSFM